jgi:U3 small nucleolar RNA-associated protein 10
MEASSKDEDESCRAAARAALGGLPVTSDILGPLLSVKGLEEAGATPPRRRRRISGGSHPQHLVVNPAALASATSTMEVLQWKKGVADPLGLVHPLQGLVSDLLAAAAADGERNATGAEGAAGLDNGAPEEDDGSRGRGENSAAACSYAMQLSLGTLQLLAKAHLVHASGPPTPLPAKPAKKVAGAAKRDPGSAPFDMALAVRAAQQAPDTAVRAAALSLVSALAEAAPQAALAHVMDVVAVVGAAVGDAAAQTLASVIPAWIGCGGPVDRLVAAVVEAATEAPPSRRAALFGAVVGALKDRADGLALVVIGLLEVAAVPSALEEEPWGLDVAGLLIQRVSGCVGTFFFPYGRPWLVKICILHVRPRISL